MAQHGELDVGRVGARARLGEGGGLMLRRQTGQGRPTQSLQQAGGTNDGRPGERDATLQQPTRKRRRTLRGEV